MMKTKLISILKILIFLPVFVFAQEFDYLTANVGENQILVYTQFTLSYNEVHEQADWVAYELTKEEVEMSRDRCNCFSADNNVSTGSASLADYSSSGFDRGHLAPAADNNMSDFANRESFLLSNMSPQSPLFNSGIWAHLESWVRTKAVEHEKIYVVTGPVFVNNLGKMGQNEVTIPGYFYKALLRFDENGNAKSIGFLLPNLGATGTLRDYVVPVNLIETLTGIDFFTNLPSNIQNRVESQTETNVWGVN